MSSIRNTTCLTYLLYRGRPNAASHLYCALYATLQHAPVALPSTAVLLI